MQLGLPAGCYGEKEASEPNLQTKIDLKKTPKRKREPSYLPQKGTIDMQLASLRRVQLLTETSPESVQD